MAKKMSKKTPKAEEPEPENRAPEASPEDIQRIKAAVFNKPEPSGKPADDIDLNQPVKDVLLGKEKDDKTLGPWREKQLAPFVAQYVKGLRQMYRFRLMQDDEQIKGYVEGLDHVSDAALGVGDILLRKYLGDIPYAEECFLGLTLVTSWKGQDRLDARLKARDAAGP